MTRLLTKVLVCVICVLFLTSGIVMDEGEMGGEAEPETSLEMTDTHSDCADFTVKIAPKYSEVDVLFVRIKTSEGEVIENGYAVVRGGETTLKFTDSPEVVSKKYYVVVRDSKGVEPLVNASHSVAMDSKAKHNSVEGSQLDSVFDTYEVNVSVFGHTIKYDMDIHIDNCQDSNSGSII